MRQRTENHFRLRQRCVFGRYEGHLSTRRQRESLATLRIGRGEGEFEGRVVGDERTKFAPGVAAGAEYAHRNSMHE